MNDVNKRNGVNEDFLKTYLEEINSKEKKSQERNASLLSQLSRISRDADFLQEKASKLKKIRRNYEDYLIRIYPSWRNEEKDSKVHQPSLRKNDKYDINDWRDEEVFHNLHKQKEKYKRYMKQVNDFNGYDHHVSYARNHYPYTTRQLNNSSFVNNDFIEPGEFLDDDRLFKDFLQKKNKIWEEGEILRHAQAVDIHVKKREAADDLIEKLEKSLLKSENHVKNMKLTTSSEDDRFLKFLKTPNRSHRSHLNPFNTRTYLPSQLLCKQDSPSRYFERREPFLPVFSEIASQKTFAKPYRIPLNGSVNEPFHSSTLSDNLPNTQGFRVLPQLLAVGDDGKLFLVPMTTSPESYTKNQQNDQSKFSLSSPELKNSRLEEKPKIINKLASSDINNNFDEAPGKNVSSYNENTFGSVSTKSLPKHREEINNTKIHLDNFETSNNYDHMRDMITVRNAKQIELDEISPVNMLERLQKQLLEKRPSREAIEEFCNIKNSESHIEDGSTLDIDDLNVDETLRKEIRQNDTRIENDEKQVTNNVFNDSPSTNTLHSPSTNSKKKGVTLKNVEKQSKHFAEEKETAVNERLESRERLSDNIREVLNDSHASFSVISEDVDKQTSEEVGNLIYVLLEKLIVFIESKPNEDFSLNPQINDDIINNIIKKCEADGSLKEYTITQIHMTFKSLLSKYISLVGKPFLVADVHPDTDFEGDVRDAINPCYLEFWDMLYAFLTNAIDGYGLDEQQVAAVYAFILIPNGVTQAGKLLRILTNILRNTNVSNTFSEMNHTTSNHDESNNCLQESSPHPHFHDDSQNEITDEKSSIRHSPNTSASLDIKAKHDTNNVNTIERLRNRESPKHLSNDSSHDQKVNILSKVKKRQEINDNDKELEEFDMSEGNISESISRRVSEGNISESISGGASLLDNIDESNLEEKRQDLTTLNKSHPPKNSHSMFLSKLNQSNNEMEAKANQSNDGLDSKANQSNDSMDSKANQSNDDMDSKDISTEEDKQLHTSDIKRASNDESQEFVTRNTDFITHDEIVDKSLAKSNDSFYGSEYNGTSITESFAYKNSNRSENVLEESLVKNDSNDDNLSQTIDLDSFHDSDNDSSTVSFDSEGMPVKKNKGVKGVEKQWKRDNIETVDVKRHDLDTASSAYQKFYRESLTSPVNGEDSDNDDLEDILNESLRKSNSIASKNDSMSPRRSISPVKSPPPNLTNSAGSISQVEKKSFNTKKPGFWNHSDSDSDIDLENLQASGNVKNDVNQDDDEFDFDFYD